MLRECRFYYETVNKYYENSPISFLRCSVLCTFCFLLSTLVSAQYTRYWIQFTDKNSSPYSVSNPAAFLSARAIQRRTNQGIAVVQNDLPVNPSYYNAIKNVPNVTIINRSRWFNAVTIQTTDPNALTMISTFTFVAGTKPVGRYKSPLSIRATLPTFSCGSVVQRGESAVCREKLEEPARSNFSGGKNGVQSPPLRGGGEGLLSTYNYGTSFNQINMIGGVCMHNMGFDGAGMQIAVLDAGFYNVDSLPMFDSLRINGQILGTWDFVENDTMVYDSHTHGTMVLSTMGGNVPGMIVGTAPKAKYWLLKTEEGATELVIEEDNWVSGAEFADSCGADILTTSLGYTTYDSVLVGSAMVVNPDNHSYAHMDGNTARISIANDIAVSKGMFAVCSAGNSGGSPWNFIGAPADADSVLAVGSVDSMKNYSWFSSNGPSFDGRVKPNVAAQGQDAVVARPDSAGILYLSGTSFAGPITAGMVACLWQAHPNSTNKQLFNAIQQTASQFSNPDTLKGYGIPDFCYANSILFPDEPSIEGNILSVYPNPFSESTIISVQGIQAHGLELNVYDILGNRVHQQTLNDQKTTLNPKLAKGIYTVELKDGGRNFPMTIGTAKLVKY
ncbi:MAG: T9SS type A sorting domain-containing protein [Bacteroidetes bacterium]|nr:MAG: T9SS type A sorting domain-containing protein [Bacteroidota bacterium]